jgi:hypothetical protein
MSTQITSVQEYLREIEAEMEALRAKVRAHEEGARLKAPSAEAATVGGIPVMHFHGPVEPFTLTARQLETVRACWNEVQVFLEPEGRIRAETVENAAASSPGTNEMSEPEGLAPEGAVTRGEPTKLNPNGAQNGAFKGAHHPLETGTADASAVEGRSPTGTGPQTDEKELAVRDRLNYGISRIDQPEKANHGWYIRITKKGHTEQKFFADKSFGGRTLALERAGEFRNDHKEHILGIPRSTQPAFVREPNYTASELTDSAPSAPENMGRFEPTADETEDEFTI